MYFFLAGHKCHMIVTCTFVLYFTGVSHYTKIVESEDTAFYDEVCLDQTFF